MPRVPPGPRRIVAQRALAELKSGSVINLGSGMPEGIGVLLSERGLSDSVYMTLESGIAGGVPETQPDFGVATNPDSMIRHDDQFCFYNSGGIDVAYLGFAEVDRGGNVNVSRFGGKVVGCGGFLDIAQNTRKLVFCGTFTSGGLRISVANGGISIDQEGKHTKFLSRVEQITFSGEYARSTRQSVLFITERCVFELRDEGLVLTEIAPGVDVDQEIFAHMKFRPAIASNLHPMRSSCFE